MIVKSSERVWRKTNSAVMAKVMRKKQRDARGAGGDVADHLGEADDVEIGETRGAGPPRRFLPDTFEFLRHADVIQPLAAVGIEFLQAGADEGAGKNRRRRDDRQCRP